MKVKALKNVACPKGTIFKIDDPILAADYSAVCEHLGEGRLEMVFSECIFKKGSIISLPVAAIKNYGKAYFDKHFEILEGAPVVEETAQEAEGDDLADAMIELMDRGEVSKTTGKPSCKTLSEMLDRDISSKERDAMFLELEAN